MALTPSMALASFAMLTDSSYMEVRISSLEAVLIARGKAVVQIHKLSHRSDTAGAVDQQRGPPLFFEHGVARTEL